MEENSEIKIIGKVDPETIESNNLFIFEYDKDVTPSVNLNSLLIKLSQHTIELITNDALGDVFEPDTVFAIHDVILKGSSGSIAYNLYDIRPGLLACITEYVEGIESLESRFYEISKCRFHVLEFMYEINVKEPNFFNPNRSYAVHFSTLSENSIKNIHATHLKLTEKAEEEIKMHVVARNIFLNHLLQFLDLKLAQLNMLSYEKPIVANLEKNADKERNLLEVWIALRQDGYLSGYTNQQITNQRKIFFEIFNLVDRDFHTNHSNWKRLKTTKGDYLKHLQGLVEKIPVKAKKRP